MSPNGALHSSQKLVMTGGLGSDKIFNSSFNSFLLLYGSKHSYSDGQICYIILIFQLFKIYHFLFFIYQKTFYLSRRKMKQNCLLNIKHRFSVVANLRSVGPDILKFNIFQHTFVLKGTICSLNKKLLQDAQPKPNHRFQNQLGAL